ncbi:hypothetical protein TL16_g02793 [Triparma laevis f. inornata]|uniref:Kinesin light chain n=1 Tax=Triparma laevis f. inornata TaxID=1714386 RepID=A0A9W7DY03_9STRA|nr:hypothetical protein TL16_g02793 [Triparma laevis f. inornata]
MPEEKKVRGKKQQLKKKNNPRKLEILDACFALGRVCGKVGDFVEAGRYLKRAKEGYEEQLGRDSEKAFDATKSLIISIVMSKKERIEKIRDLLKRMERALGEENVVTLETLNVLGGRLKDNREYEEAKEVYERCFAGRMKVLGEDHRQTLAKLVNLGGVCHMLKNYEKALEYYEKALKGNENVMGKTHPNTLHIVMNIASVYENLIDFGKAQEYFERALEGYEAQLGKDHR